MSGKRRAELTKDAVPSIFDGAPGYLSKKIKSPRKKTIRQTCGELTRTFTRAKCCEETAEQETHPRSLAENAVPKQSAYANEAGDATEAAIVHSTHVSTLSLIDCSRQLQAYAFARHRWPSIELTATGLRMSCSMTLPCLATAVTDLVCCLTESLCTSKVT